MSVNSAIADDSDQLEEHASVKQIMANAEQGRSVTLEQCFEVRLVAANKDLYTTPLVRYYIVFTIHTRVSINAKGLIM